METEKIEPLVNINELPQFPLIWRCRFGSDKKRVYYRKGFNKFYSGVTTAIAKSGLVDKSYLSKIKIEKAFEGVDIEEEWDVKKNYGTVFHTLVSLHERNDSTHRPFVFDDMDENGAAWRQDVKKWSIEYECPQNYEFWCDQVQNDFAAWFKFKRDYNVKVIASEIPVFHDEWLICTPLDIVCEMDFNKKRIFANINIKTGTGSDGKDYTLQVCMEQFLWDKTMRESGAEKFLLGGTFTWKPKDRFRAPADYSLSKNYSGAHSMAEMNHVANGVVLTKANEPGGVIRTYKGGEHDFSFTDQTPAQYLEEFNKEITV